MPSLTKLRQKLDIPQPISKREIGEEYVAQAERLGQYTNSQENESTGSTQATEAKFITGQDPVIQTSGGGRLPAVPVEEAVKLNRLKDLLEDREPTEPIKSGTREAKDGTIHGAQPAEIESSKQNSKPDAPLTHAIPPPKTNPLFPPLPMWGPPTLLRNLQCWSFRVSSAILSLCFLGVIMLGAIFTSIPPVIKSTWLRLTLRNPESLRPFYEEEKQREKLRKDAEQAWGAWKKKGTQNRIDTEMVGNETNSTPTDYQPLEGGRDPLICDVSYYARRVGLDCETFWVTTEDGFILELWHIYNPREYKPADSSRRAPQSPDTFPTDHTTNETKNGASGFQYSSGSRRYPVLMIHGLLQSSGAYCSNDDDSLAFFLAKSGYDVWLGNSRCGFKPRHNLLKYEDPRMWAWNIRQMGVMDLPAFISRVLSETGFEKLALIAHSQGTTQTLVALAKEQRPEIGSKISVFCALAPAAYAGPLIGKMYFKFMRVISPGMFRLIFGIHAFIPFMMYMHSLLPGRFYGTMGYLIFRFLFDWSDTRWDRGLRDRMFQFAPVYVSAESMRWWLGRECFAHHKCILATREEKKMEDHEDEEEDKKMGAYFSNAYATVSSDSEKLQNGSGSRMSVADINSCQSTSPERAPNRCQVPLYPLQPKTSPPNAARYSWFDEHFPPLALWVAGSDDLVDGKRLLRRFERGREPYVKVVHAKVIEEYEHLDVIWAMDMIEKVGKEIREVIWQTAPEEAKSICRIPVGCGQSNNAGYHQIRQ